MGRGQRHKSLSKGAHTRESLSGDQGQVGDWAEREAPSLVRISLRGGDYKLHGIEEKHLQEKNTGPQRGVPTLPST